MEFHQLNSRKYKRLCSIVITNSIQISIQVSKYSPLCHEILQEGKCKGKILQNIILVSKWFKSKIYLGLKLCAVSKIQNLHQDGCQPAAQIRLALLMTQYTRVCCKSKQEKKYKSNQELTHCKNQFEDNRAIKPAAKSALHHSKAGPLTVAYQQKNSYN